jgi:hypothetical protein
MHNSETISLWESLHDGYFERVMSNPLSRAVTITVDAPSRWEFYSLPAETRIEIVGEEGSLDGAFEFQTGEEYVILNADVEVTGSTKKLRLEIYSYPNSNLCEVNIQAVNLRFFIGQRELSLAQFAVFSSSYWERSTRSQDSAENGVR